MILHGDEFVVRDGRWVNGQDRSDACFLTTPLIQELHYLHEEYTAYVLMWPFTQNFMKSL
jgi:hypothetical protein